MKTLLSLMLLIPSLSWGEVKRINPFEGSDDLSNKKILCKLIYSEGGFRGDEFDPNDLSKFIDKKLHNSFDKNIFLNDLKLKRDYYIKAPDWDIFLYGFEFMKDNNVVVYDVSTIETIDKTSLPIKYGYFKPDFKKTFAYYYADEENITIQTREENKQFLFLARVNRYTLDVEGDGSANLARNCKVVDHSIGKNFNKIKKKTEKYFQDIEAEREKIKYRERKI